MKIARRDPLTIRVPPGMRNRIRERAVANRRSLNSEIVHYLDCALEAQEAKGPAEAPTSPSHDQNHNPAKNGGIDA